MKDLIVTSGTNAIPTATITMKIDDKVFKKAGFSALIWANHSLRASIKAIQDVTNHLIKKETLKGLEEKISSLNEVFDLAGNAAEAIQSNNSANLNDLIPPTVTFNPGVDDGLRLYDN